MKSLEQIPEKYRDEFLAWTRQVIVGGISTGYEALCPICRHRYVGQTPGQARASCVNHMVKHFTPKIKQRR